MRGSGFARFASLIFCAAICLGTSEAQLTNQVNGSSFQLADAPRQLRLVNGLQEISGLAIASENSVYAHNDEHGIVYEVSLDTGDVLAAFALGGITELADFEGIETENGRIYLVTSDGKIYEALIGEHRKRVRFNVFDTGIGSNCEIEGLSRGFEAGSFFALCKSARIQSVYNKLTVYKWSVNDRRPVTEPWLQIPYENFLTADEAEDFRPSAIEWDRKKKVFVILSAQSRQLTIVSEDGSILSTEALLPEFHPQAEGVAITPSGDLVIADEGAGRHPGTLSFYGASR